MLSGYLLSFVGGIAADIVRKIFLPKSEAALARIFPSLQIERNRKTNLEQLQIREKLVALGKDPSLANEIDRNADDFQLRLDTGHSGLESAFVEVEAERLDQFASTQAEMNMVANDRFVAADRLMTSKFDQLIDSKEASDAAKIALRASQALCLSLRDSAAETEALFTAEGGSMMPMVRGMAMEHATIVRIAELNHYLELQFER